jgi:salicylate hydroxylase
MAASTKMCILIIGAGPVGLAAATALALDGHQVTVLERHPTLQTIGGTIGIQAPAVRALKQIGLEEKLCNISLASESMNFWSYKDPDKPMGSIQTSPGVKAMMTERPAAQGAFYESAIAAGATVQFGQSVNRVDEDATPPRVWTANGQDYTADLIVCADGIKSTMRKLMFPLQNVEPVPTNECIFQALLEQEVVASDPRLEPYLTPGSAHGTLGPGRFSYFRVTPRGQLHLLFIAMNYGSPEADGTNANWNTPGDPDELRSLFSDFSILPRACLEHIESCLRWRIAVATPIDSWRGKSGRVLLLGDAAHAMLPHAAQGVSQGIEGAVALARFLRLVNPNKDNIPRLLEYYEQFRRPRVEKFVSMSENNAARHSLPDGPQQEARDAQFRSMNVERAAPVDWTTVEMDMNAPPHSPGLLKWIRDYDVTVEVSFCKA